MILRAVSFILLASAAFAERPNILLVLSDDHSVPHVGAYGDANCQRLNLTPNLDAFAAEGMRFDRAYTTAPQCAPSRISIFAGRSPVALSATRFAQPARPGTLLLTDALRAEGYWVGVDGRNQHLEGKRKDAPHVVDELEKMSVRGEHFEGRFDHFIPGASTKGEHLAKVPDMLDSALDKVPEGKPFFLYFGFNQPHRKWGDDHEGIEPTKLKLPPDWPDLPEVRLDYARYLAEVRDLDRGFGLLLETLEKRGLSENTLVVFMGDNGEALLRGKGTLYGRGLHVPLMVRWPEKIKPGTESDVLVSGEDFAPTLLAAVGMDAPVEMTGVNFLPALLGNSFTGREQVFAERGWHSGPITRSDGFDLSRSITTKRYNFIYNAIPERGYTPVDMAKKNAAWNAIKAARESSDLSELHERLYFDSPRPVFELYDLENDPYEMNNLADTEAVREVEEDLREKLDRWMVREGDYLPLPVHAMKGLKGK
ncbi:MAG: sulfatase [Verrucomicrobiota bacterium]|nr:sulfatase [Verrucomicrobiota bacterium]